MGINLELVPGACQISPKVSNFKIHTRYAVQIPKLSCGLLNVKISIQRKNRKQIFSEVLSSPNMFIYSLTTKPSLNNPCRQTYLVWNLIFSQWQKRALKLITSLTLALVQNFTDFVLKLKTTCFLYGHVVSWWTYCHVLPRSTKLMDAIIQESLLINKPTRYANEQTY
jgi:hypothetical protein